MQRFQEKSKALQCKSKNISCYFHTLFNLFVKLRKNLSLFVCLFLLLFSTQFCRYCRCTAIRPSISTAIYPTTHFKTCHTICRRATIHIKLRTGPKSIYHSSSNPTSSNLYCCTLFWAKTCASNAKLSIFSESTNSNALISGRCSNWWTGSDGCLWSRNPPI